MRFSRRGRGRRRRSFGGRRRGARRIRIGRRF